MFTYEADTDNARSYRPDLHTLIQRWLSGVPREAWQYFVAFRVGDKGEFVAKFMKAADGDDSGHLRPIYVVIDHGKTLIYTDTHWFSEPCTTLLSMRALSRAANTF